MTDVYDYISTFKVSELKDVKLFALIGTKHTQKAKFLAYLMHQGDFQCITWDDIKKSNLTALHSTHKLLDLKRLKGFTMMREAIVQCISKHAFKCVHQFDTVNELETWEDNNNVKFDAVFDFCPLWADDEDRSTSTNVFLNFIGFKIKEKRHQKEFSSFSPSRMKILTKVIKIAAECHSLAGNMQAGAILSLISDIVSIEMEKLFNRSIDSSYIPDATSSPVSSSSSSETSFKLSSDTCPTRGFVAPLPTDNDTLVVNIHAHALNGENTPIVDKISSVTSNNSDLPHTYTFHLNHPPKKITIEF